MWSYSLPTLPCVFSKSSDKSSWLLCGPVSFFFFDTYDYIGFLRVFFGFEIFISDCTVLVRYLQGLFLRNCMVLSLSHHVSSCIMYCSLQFDWIKIYPVFVVFVFSRCYTVINLYLCLAPLFLFHFRCYPIDVCSRLVCWGKSCFLVSCLLQVCGR